MDHLNDEWLPDHIQEDVFLAGEKHRPGAERYSSRCVLRGPHHVIPEEVDKSKLHCVQPESSTYAVVRPNTERQVSVWIYLYVVFRAESFWVKFVWIRVDLERY